MAGRGRARAAGRLVFCMLGGASPKQVTAEMGLGSEKPRGLCFGGVSVSVCACADLAGGAFGLWEEEGDTRETT